MAQTFGGIGGEVKDKFKFVLGEKPVNEFNIIDGAADKFRFARNVILKAAAQIIQPDHLMALLQQMRGDVRTDETSDAGDENF